MNNTHTSLYVVLKNTVYWDGTYVLDKQFDWQIERDYCFLVKAIVSDTIVIELYDCTKTAAARFVCTKENETFKVIDIADDYCNELKDATVQFSFLE